MLSGRPFFFILTLFVSVPAAYSQGMGSAEAYEILGVSDGDGPAEIKAKYYALAKQLHSDVTKTAEGEERFKAVAAAYRLIVKTVSSADLRTRFDDIATRYNLDFSISEGMKRGELLEIEATDRRLRELVRRYYLIGDTVRPVGPDEALSTRLGLSLDGFVQSFDQELRKSSLDAFPYRMVSTILDEESVSCCHPQADELLVALVTHATRESELKAILDSDVPAGQRVWLRNVDPILKYPRAIRALYAQLELSWSNPGGKSFMVSVLSKKNLLGHPNFMRQLLYSRPSGEVWNWVARQVAELNTNTRINLSPLQYQLLLESLSLANNDEIRFEVFMHYLAKNPEALANDTQLLEELGKVADFSFLRAEYLSLDDIPENKTKYQLFSTMLVKIFSADPELAEVIVNENIRRRQENKARWLDEEDKLRFQVEIDMLAEIRERRPRGCHALFFKVK